MTSRLSPRELDRRVVPVAAARLRRLLSTSSQVRADAVDAAARASRQLDERVTARGPLRRVHQAPQLALPVVAAVLVAGVAGAVLLDDEPDRAVPSVAPAPRIVDLGVPPGADVDTHLRQAQQDLADVAARLPSTRLLAVVHFDRYVAAEEVMPLLADTQIQRVYLRAGNAGPETEVLAVPGADGPLATVLPALCEATSTRAAQQVGTFNALAAAVPPDAADQQETKARFDAEAQRSAAEAEAFSGECVTGFAAVVEAPVDVLRALVERDGVRGVEAAPSGTSLGDVDVDPLFPEAVGILPEEES